MTQTALVEREKPEIVLVRCYKTKYDLDDPESAIETDIPMWLLFDRANEEVFFRGTLHALRNHITFLLSRDQLPRDSNVEYIYSTSNKVSPDDTPCGVVLPMAEVLRWLKEVEDTTNVARHMYKEEFN